MAAVTITTALLDFLGEKLKDYNIKNFYQEIRDDSKDKSLTLYTLGTIANSQTYGEQVRNRMDYQLQVVNGNSVSETEALAHHIYHNIVQANKKFEASGFEFYISPLLNRVPRYLGTLSSGCHKYGIDILITYKKKG